MLSSQPFMREDTFLGVCHTVGHDFGFSPNILRMAFAGMLFWNPTIFAVTYVSAGVMIAVLHWLLPNPLMAEEPWQIPAAEAEAPAPVTVEPVPEELAAAA